MLKLLVVMLGVVLLPSRATAQSSHPRMDVTLDFDRPSYRPGDPILVRVHLRNVSSGEVSLPSVSAPSLVRLRVRNASGQDIERGRAEMFPIALSIFTLKRGQEAVLGSFSGNAWINLEDFGFKLPVPGVYTVSGTTIGGRLDAESAAEEFSPTEARFAISEE
jgi:hypothetical protein